MCRYSYTNNKSGLCSITTPYIFRTYDTLYKAPSGFISHLQKDARATTCQSLPLSPRAAAGNVTDRQQLPGSREAGKMCGNVSVRVQRANTLLLMGQSSDKGAPSRHSALEVLERIKYYIHITKLGSGGVC